MIIHATKLHQPQPRANWIARSRLLALLDTGRQEVQGLVLVSAPAGAGKTTLVGQWLAKRAARSAWLSLDAEDDDPARFWTCVVYALQTVAPALGESVVEALNAPAPPPLSSLLPGLLNALGEQAEPVTLVLDDYHVITAKGIHDSLAAVVEHLPPQLQLVICTRADPPLPLARWRARANLVEVRAADLRFTPAEALAFLNERMALDLQPEDAAQLVERTEGWAAGLQLAGLSLRGQANPRRAIQSFARSRHYVLDYLLEEVLTQLPAVTQQFLLRTSILKRMCGPLCDAVTEEHGSSTTLLDLQRQNLFVVPLDEERFWFRYHHLFADLLRARLQQTAAENIRLLHQRAASWCEQNGLAVDAVQHALAAENWAMAASLLEAHEQDWWTGSDVTVMNLLPHLPDEVVLRGPNLSVYKAWFLLIRGQLSAAGLLLSKAASILSGEDAGAHKELASFVLLQQAYIAELLGSPAAQPPDLSALRHIPESRGAMRNSAEVILAYVLYREGRFDAAEHLLLATIARDERTGATNGIPISASRLVRLWIAGGRLNDAATLCRRCQAIVEERGKWRFFVCGNLNIVLGDILREWNQLEEAESLVRRGIQDNDPWQVAHAYALGHTVLARVLLARGDLAGAVDALAEQVRLTSGRVVPPDLASETRAVRLRISLALGDLQSVAAWADEWAPQAQAFADFRAEQDLLTLARAWLALGQANRASSLLANLAHGALAGGRMRRLAEIRLLGAVSRQAQGNMQEAVVAVEQSLAAAASEGCIRMFLDEGPGALALVAAANRTRTLAPAAQAFTRRILAAAPPMEQASPMRLPSKMATLAEADVQGSQSLVEPLTAREREVLVHLAGGCSNQDIAERLVISLHAVKKHTGNIYGKLGVTSRTQAIIRARELGLIA
jgi:LuxR family maltose regulon positive regulatory protein